MAQEIERKFLLEEDGVDYSTLSQMYSSVWALKKNVLANGIPICQGYLPLNLGLRLSNKLEMDFDFEPREVRLRKEGEETFFTLKSSGEISRGEIQVRIGRNLFEEYFSKTRGKRIRKVRLAEPFEGYVAEFDVYLDRDLIVAEVEIPTIAQVLNELGRDVTDDEAYKNRKLAK